MRTRTKIWLIIGASLVMLGCILFAGVMSRLNWDFTKLSTVKYETNTYEISDAFDAISIDTDTADIVFRLSDNGTCRVECHEEEKAKNSVTVEEDTLNIKLLYEKSVYFGLNFGSPKITVYLPKTEYTSLLINESTGDIEIPKDFNFNKVDIKLSTGDVIFKASTSDMIKIKTSTGDIGVENISAGSLNLSVSTGKVSASDVTSGNTGDISLDNIIAAEKFSIVRSTGDVRLKNSDATEILIETETGDVIGNLLTDKVFITNTDTGKVNVPKTVSGGKCEITTDTGDIMIEVK